MENIIKIIELKEGDVLLFEGKQLLSRMISKYDGTDYSHSAIYIGNKNVIEAVTGGVQRNTLIESCKLNHSKKISVLRLVNRQGDMSPVLRKAESFMGNGFAQSQIIILGLIMISRAHRLNDASALFIDRILQDVAVELFEFTKRNKEPFICSELVYRSYNEALSELDDPYTINLIKGSTTPLGLNANISNESFISKVYGINAKLFNPRIFTSPFIEEENVVTSEFDKQLNDNLEQELELLYEQQVESFKNEDYEINKEKAQQLKRSMEQFLSALYFSKKRDNEFTNPENSNEILKSYLKDNANFVTPGDLFRATNLMHIGDLDLEEINIRF